MSQSVSRLAAKYDLEQERVEEIVLQRQQQKKRKTAGWRKCRRKTGKQRPDR